MIDDGELINYQVFRSPTLEDAAWRRKVKDILTKRIKDTLDFNTMFKGKVKPRTIDPLWSRMVGRIAEIDRRIGLYGTVDTGLYVWKPYILSSDSDQTEAEESKSEEDVGSLDQAFYGNESNDASNSGAVLVANQQNDDSEGMPELEGSEDEAAPAGTSREASAVSNEPVADNRVLSAVSAADTGFGASGTGVDDVSDGVDEPTDRVYSFPITDNSIISDASSFVTSEEDDRAIADDIIS